MPEGCGESDSVVTVRPEWAVSITKSCKIFERDYRQVDDRTMEDNLACTIGTRWNFIYGGVKRAKGDEMTQKAKLKRARGWSAPDAERWIKYERG